MTTLTEIRSGLAANVATINGLRSAPVVPDQINPPIAIVMPSRISFDRAMHRGLDEYEFVVTVFVGRADERVAQNLLDAYCNPTGTSSVKTALEGDRTLGGAVSDLRVTEMRGITPVLVGDTTYLTAEFVVSVFAQ
jgi:hypothetical protein